MKPYVDNIEKKTLDNEYFREVLYTGPNLQLVVMSLKAGEEIGMEIHEEHDQFLRIDSGQGEAILDGVSYELSDGFAVVVPAGTEHNIINTGERELKLYTIYAPPEHPASTIHETKPENA